MTTTADTAQPASGNQRSRKMLACTAEATAYQKAFGQELRVHSGAPSKRGARFCAKAFTPSA